MPATRQGPADDHDPAGIGIDHDLMGRGVSIVLWLLGHRVVARGHQGAVDDEDGVPAESAPLPERQQRTEAINNAVCGLTRIRRPRPLRHRLDPPVGTWRAKPVGVLYLPDQQHRPGPGAA